MVSRTVTLTGTPAFAIAFAFANVAGLITCAANSYSGSGMGKRFEARENSTIRSAGATLPGNQAGTTAKDGVFT